MEQLEGKHTEGVEQKAKRWFDISLTTAWTIWNDRNLELHEGHRRNPAEVVDFIRSFLLEYQRCQQAVAIRPVLVEKGVWKVPDRVN
ncbi:hypothetical protein COLO4_19126 [Corchorus olitorius]|uniref:Uncharacterized protein n=1 Tax=Corchorus olitorius TaxID=93759 RepID=A0A1R3J6M8_9ROSI|nr:hypothetical protein COLO4_19126 [Corchorus olitorius]